MGKKFRNLYDSIINKDNLWNAYKRTSKGKRKTLKFLSFKENEAFNIENLHRKLLDETYSPGEPILFEISDPKPRIISALPFEDRIVQHAMYSILEPIFERTFLPNSFACRRQKGTHRAAIKTQSLIRKNPDSWVLKTDFSKYFASIDREILFREIERKVSCKRTLTLIEKFVSRNGFGISIGNLISQLFANVYGNLVDHWIVHHSKISNFVRYMDDIVIFGNSLQDLKEFQKKLEEFCVSSLKLKFSKWSISHSKNGINFCGYRIWKDFKLLRKRSVISAKRKITNFRKFSEMENLMKFLASWKGHAKWANSFNLLKSMNVAT